MVKPQQSQPGMPQGAPMGQAGMVPGQQMQGQRMPPQGYYQQQGQGMPGMPPPFPFPCPLPPLTSLVRLQVEAPCRPTWHRA